MYQAQRSRCKVLRRNLLEYTVLSAANMSAAIWLTGFRPVGLGAAALSEFVEYKHGLPQLSRLGMAVQMH